MVNKLWRLVVVGVVVSLLATSATAAEKQTKEDRDRKARAALAIAATKDARPAATVQAEHTVRISLQIACEVIRAVVSHLEIDDDEEYAQISFRRSKAQAALAACVGPNCPAPGPSVTPGTAPAVVPVVEVTGSCANGQCPAPVTQPTWYPGQRLFRRVR